MGAPYIYIYIYDISRLRVNKPEVRRSHLLRGGSLKSFSVSGIFLIRGFWLQLNIAHAALRSDRTHTCADSNVGGWQTLGPQLWGAGTKSH